MRRICIAAASLVLLTVPALADSVKGTVVAFDRVARVIVLDDKTIWPLGKAEIPIPEDLKAGDVIVIDYTSAGESGLGAVVSVKREPS